MRFLSLFLFAAALSPADILRLHFTGAIRPGTALGSTFDISSRSTVPVDIGTTVVGYVDLDYSALPVPTVTVNPGNVVHQFETNTLSPQWLGFFLQLSFTPPANTLPIPGSLDSTRWIAAPGDSEITPTEMTQRLVINEVFDTRLITFAHRSNFNTAPGGIRQQDKTLALLVDSLPAITPTGASAFGPVVPNLKSGFFQQQQFERVADAGQGIFGMIESSLVTAQFDVTSLRGELLAPEPAAWLWAMPCLIWVVRRRRQESGH